MFTSSCLCSSSSWGIRDKYSEGETALSYRGNVQNHVTQFIRHVFKVKYFWTILFERTWVIRACVQIFLKAPSRTTHQVNNRTIRIYFIVFCDSTNLLLSHPDLRHFSNNFNFVSFVSLKSHFPLLSRVELIVGAEHEYVVDVDKSGHTTNVSRRYHWT